MDFKILSVTLVFLPKVTGTLKTILKCLIRTLYWMCDVIGIYIELMYVLKQIMSEKAD